MVVVGLTGPMGAGKSEVAAMLRDLGAVCLRADDASRELLSHDLRLLAEVRGALGGAVFNADGTLNRPRAAALVFRDAQARRALEQLLHPPMVAWMRAQLGALARQEPAPEIVVLEAAILTHMGARDLADVVVRVWADRDTCLQRTAARDGLSPEQAAERLAIHEELGLFSEPADYVLDTSGTLQETRREVGRLWEALRLERGVG